MAKQTKRELFDSKSANAQGPVECLGMTFPNDEARRAHFTEKLREKLKDPEFRKIEGFPIGDDEDILAISDPPYYTACPNPWLEAFITCYRTPCDHTTPYYRTPFVADVSEGKYHPIYKLHPYHTKVPHKAIMRYILHYTQPGDVVCDGFCGTGMTGIASALCGNVNEIVDLGYQVTPDGVVLDENETPVSKAGVRVAVLSDLAPAATFISSHGSSIDTVAFKESSHAVVEEVAANCSWMYSTLVGATPSEVRLAAQALRKCKTESEVRALLSHPDTLRSQIGSDRSSLRLGTVNFVVWSDVFLCSECDSEVVFWDAAVEFDAGKIKSDFFCPTCNASLKKRTLKRKMSSVYDRYLRTTLQQGVQVPVFINARCNTFKIEKRPDEFDLAILELSGTLPVDVHPPIFKLVEDGFNTSQPIRSHGFTHVHHFYTDRNLSVLVRMLDTCDAPTIRALVTKVAFRITKRYGLTCQGGSWGAGGGPTTGTLYIPSLVKELNMISMLENAADVSEADTNAASARTIISTQSFSSIGVPSESVDYLFLDPPFGANIMYSELNSIWEAWLGVRTASALDAIENAKQGKSIAEYRSILCKCFEEAYRILKPGRWVTVEFSNTQASVWNAIQATLQDVGFVVANVSMLDKQKGSFKAITTTTAVKQDLIISAYKPDGEFEERFSQEAQTEEGVWDFIRTHMKYLPVTKHQGAVMQVVAERDPRILFDQVVAYYVRNRMAVPISSQEFQLGLAQRFPERDGMYFLTEQVSEYEHNRIVSKVVEQPELFVSDEQSAIQWVRRQLAARPMKYQDLSPLYMKEAQRVWEKHEQPLELRTILEQNFVEDTKGVWQVPDPKNEAHLEQIRNRALLKEFQQYLDVKGKLKIVRTEALRAGFKDAWQRKDYTTIVQMAKRVPDAVIQEDQALLMYFDNASLMLGE